MRIKTLAIILFIPQLLWGPEFRFMPIEPVDPHKKGPSNQEEAEKRKKAPLSPEEKTQVILSLLAQGENFDTLGKQIKAIGILKEETAKESSSIKRQHLKQGLLLLPAKEKQVLREKLERLLNLPGAPSGNNKELNDVKEFIREILGHKES